MLLKILSLNEPGIYITKIDTEIFPLKIDKNINRTKKILTKFKINTDSNMLK